jgi:hypothetical protein
MSTTSISPILPQIVQNRTPADTSSPPTPISCTASPINPPGSFPLLSPRQLNAIPLILLGQSDEQVAQSVGVRRQAICNWRNHHPRFIAELNRQRQLHHASLIDRYHHLLDRCLTAITRFQDDCDHWTQEQAEFAAKILRSAARRTLASTAPLPTNPNEILEHLLSQNQEISPEDSESDTAPPPPTPTKKSPRPTSDK